MIELLMERFPFAFAKIGLRYFAAAGILFVIFYWIFKERLPIQKIQKKYPKAKDYFRDTAYSAVTVAIFALIAILSFWYWKDYNVLYESLDAMPMWYWWLTAIPIFFIHDFYFYWAHRFMHLPKVYKWVHRVHHLSTNPSPWTAYAFHPLEAVVEAGILTVLAFTVPTHVYVILIFMIFQIIYNVYGHLGFELYPRGFHKTWIGKYVNTAVSHNQHHEKFHGNYGLYTLIWDRLFGTLRSDYDQAFEAATIRRNQIEQTTEYTG
ncbi:MAG: lathosterol oxidase [Marinoscillum sp.]|jgi:lathosterol oxidase